jgi:hypothetical protein
LVKQPVSLGITDGRYVEITAGLNGNESVVATISPALNQDERVNPVQATMVRSSTKTPEIASDQ